MSSKKENMEAGICYIKPEYIIADTEQQIALIIGSQETLESNKRELECDTANELVEGETRTGKENKRCKINKKERKRGQNKNRPVYKEDRTLNLCNSLLMGPTEKICSLENCRYVHDLELYMANKQPDLAERCPVFNVKGYCPRGVTCRFAKAHLDERCRNIKSDDYIENGTKTTYNGITTELQVRLRKHDYDFSKSKELIKQSEQIRDLRKQQKFDSIEKPVGCVIDEEIKVKGRDMKSLRSSIDFANKLILSPLTTVGNLPFRRICKEFGADITCGEMACCVPLVKGLTQEWALTKRHESEDIFGIQLCGNNPNIVTQAAQLVQDTTKVDYLDLNIGCPIDLIYQQGGGSALMRRTNILELIVRSCAKLNSNIPFTVKMRTGVYADKSVAHDIMPLIEEWGAAAVTLHGRSREQRYTKSANWSYIEECAAKIKNIPVIGNGDILSYEDYNEKREISPHVSSVMIGRGALIKPWIFQEIKQQKHWSPTSSERYELLRKYVNYGLEHWGSDTKGVENTRRFLLEWQSFLYRYIPYELLLRPPQKINERPQKYRGRDEMETLMSSPNSQDWVKLSETLLGPVPEGFTFVPKHKANAY
uniref:tRNA-dihydrouridine(47) synthase [NAD(P)(+)] n=1 Tax=Glossina brevipalpis TaxID=37001 RepID=A0A1A9WKB1_9MUSC